LPRVIVLGDVITDVIVRLREPLAHGSDTRASIDVKPGGSGANQAAWLAWLGVETHFVGRMGDDPFGSYSALALQRSGVTPHLVTDSSATTGFVVSLVEPDGERSMITDRGANLNGVPSDFPSSLLTPGDHFHLSGYLLFYPQTRDLALTALEGARESGMTISLDPVAASLIRDIGADTFLEWTKGADLVVPNLDEGMALTGEDSPEDVARVLARSYTTVALKLGSEGAILLALGESPVHGPAVQTEVVDTTGAGDAFCAGLLAAWLRGASPKEALAEGNRLGALAVSRVGARPDGH
jgi:sugar/nucleoside kinase (ribokinase family)